ncbi:efflux RND transporter periplasmic adaptor subunit [Desulfosporosinus sp. PR]|uniref:efflux RND transporter periplasmic adaptor subunit n=1 Tax=Candidatus Desulfosporosinus nitrosoreducens TaxID=3401928 RepID=UPI0027F6D1E4|nr:efflux RND transporter periplasmic adaptor subunit [Desulfosporosinus sp. PR]MDQ7093405.1 efflux RND transporter periplasmic adaptor subunit [Desulfosporosinus sp. PR]
MKKRPIDYVISGVLIIAVALVGGNIFYNTQNAKASTPSYITGNVRIGTVEKSVSATGTIQALNQYDLSSSSGGKITEIDVKVGDQVKSGQVLAKLDPTQAQQQVTQDQNALTQAQLKLNQLYAPPSEVNVLNAQSAVLKAQSSEASALSNLQTLESYKSSATLKAAIQKLQAAGQGSNSQLSTLQDYLDNTADLNSAISQASISYQLAQADLKTAEAQVSQANAGPSSTDVQLAQNQVDQAKTTLSSAQEALDSAVIKAPADGTVTAVNGQVGGSPSGSSGNGSSGNSQGSSSGSSAFISMIGTSDTMQVVVPVNQVDIAKVSVGQSANITLDAYQGQTFSGSVTQVSPTGTSQSGVTTFNVTVNVANQDNEMKSGMSANVTIIVAEKQNVLTVPSSAIHTNGSQETVSLLSSGSSVPVVRTVQTGLDDGKNVEVVQGLEEGDKVVIGTRSTQTKDSQTSQTGNSLNKALSGSNGSYGGGYSGAGGGRGSFTGGNGGSFSRS